MTLNNITNEYLSLLTYISHAEGELSPEAEAELAKLEADLKNKADDYVGIIRQMEGFGRDCKDEAKRLGERAAMWDRKADCLRTRLLQAMRALKTDKISTARNTVSVCMNNSTPVVMVPGAMVPDDYMIVKQVESVNMDAIRERLNAGDELSFARLGQRGTHLRIK